MKRQILEVIETYGALFVASRVTDAPTLCYPLINDLEQWGKVARRTDEPRDLERIYYDIRAFWPDGTESVTWTLCPKNGRRWYVPNFDFYYRALVSEKTGKAYGPDFLPSNKVRRIVAK